jgi:hypothetical protein
LSITAFSRFFFSLALYLQNDWVLGAIRLNADLSCAYLARRRAFFASHLLNLNFSTRMNRASSVVRETSFRYPDTWLVRPRIRLYGDRLELTGWRFTGRHRRVIELSEIASIKWWSGVNHAANLDLHLDDGEQLSLWVKGPGLWRFKITEHAPDIEEQNPSLKQNVAAPTA